MLFILVSLARTTAPTAPLAVIVRPDPPAWEPAPPPRAPRPPVAWGSVSIQVDGDLSEWADVPAAPPLLPMLDGRTPPNGLAKFVIDDAGLAALLPATPATPATQHLLIDPEGTSQRWFVATVDATGVRWTRCTLAGISLPIPASTPSKAAPCAPVAGESAVGEAGVELRLPRAEAPRWTTGLGLLWTVEGAGTWAPYGRALVAPHLARRVIAPADPPSPAVRVDHAAWTIQADPSLTRWHRWTQGRLVDEGALVGGQAKLPPVALPDVVVEVSGDGAPLAPAATATVRSAVAGCRLASPVIASTITLAWEMNPGGVLPISLFGDDRPLGSAEVALPAGTGTLEVAAPPGASPLQVRCGNREFTVARAGPS